MAVQKAVDLCSPPPHLGCPECLIDVYLQSMYLRCLTGVYLWVPAVFDRCTKNTFFTECSVHERERGRAGGRGLNS